MARAMTALVMDAVVEHESAERHVPDHQVVPAIAILSVGERLGTDLRLRV